uniref:Uncharacterized protein n=1 Tax=Oryza meridionalis TaxID=40149 RepID=A0A0E0F451_9ORYZ
MAAVAERKVLGMVAAVAAMVMMMVALPAAALVPYGYGYGYGLWDQYDHHLLDDPFRVLKQSPLRPAGGVDEASRMLRVSGERRRRAAEEEEGERDGVR